MAEFDISALKRNPKVIKASLKTVGGTVVTTVDMRVMYPSRYVNKNIATIGNYVNVLGIFAVIDDNDNYSVFSIPTFINLSPYKIEEVTLGETLYTLLYFGAKDVMITSDKVVKIKSYMYDLFDEFFIHGNIPWFLNYDDTSNILSLSSKYAGSGIGDDPLGMEILTGTIARDSEDKKIYYRSKTGIPNYTKTRPPAYVALLNIFYTFRSTTNKLAGSYFKRGILGSLVDKGNKTTTIEKMIRA